MRSRSGVATARRATRRPTATKIVPAGPVRGILQGGHQVFSTILMYTEKRPGRGRGTILVAIESTYATGCTAPDVCESMHYAVVY